MLDMDGDPGQLALFYRFATAMLLGLLVGLQREYATRRKDDDRRGSFAGARTHALLGLLGAAAAMVADETASAWVLATTVFVFGALLTVSYAVSARAGQIGITSEVAALIVVLAGALCYLDRLALAAALAVGTTVLLAIKLQTTLLASRLTEEDVRATLTFAVLTLIVLPVLPRESPWPEPFAVLVPYKVWLMVVFISGISFLGYVMIKIVGPRRGVGLTGLLGGLASSTAVTLSFAQRSHGASTLARPFALAILLAWTVMFVRVLLEVAAINPGLLGAVALPMVAAATVSLGYCAWLYRARQDTAPAAHEEFTNPFELAPALTFGLIYTVILLVANLARLHFGSTGLYLSAIASGVADVDAITLSMAELSRAGSVDPALAARAIVLAAATNTVVKGAIVLATGAMALRRAILPGLTLTVVTAVAVAFLL